MHSCRIQYQLLAIPAADQLFSIMNACLDLISQSVVIISFFPLLISLHFVRQWNLFYLNRGKLLLVLHQSQCECRTERRRIGNTWCFEENDPLACCPWQEFQLSSSLSENRLKAHIVPNLRGPIWKTSWTWSLNLTLYLINFWLSKSRLGIWPQQHFKGTSSCSNLVVHHLRYSNNLRPLIAVIK